MLTKDFPDHHDAELVLKLYELRREPVMRDSRALLAKEFWPRTAGDVFAVMKPEHPLNAAWRQVGSYWEMTYAMAKHNVIHPDFMLESCGEGIYLFARVEPYLAELREHSPFAFRNTEWIVTQSERGKVLLDLFRKRVQAALTAKS